MRVRHWFGALLLTVCWSASSFAQQVAAPVAQTQSVSSAPIRSIIVKGNQRIEQTTIISYLGLTEGGTYSQYDIDNALKNLFATGFFTDAKIEPGENPSDLTVTVFENPVINRVVFEGNKAVEDKDLQSELELKARAIYTRTKLQNDVKRILDIYRRGGRYSAQLEPKVISLDQNRIDLVYEIEEGEVAKVKKISFIGNDNFDSAVLRSAVRTEETRWYKFLGSDDKYDPERLQYDQELLRRFYTGQGYADFQVKAAIAELSPAKDAFYLTFTLDEGRKYKFGKIDVNTAIKGITPEELQKSITTKQSSTYDASKVESSIDALTKELGNRGFAFVDISPKFNRKPDEQVIDVAYNIKEGPRVYVEKINITGNLRTLDEVIRREFRMAEGDPYSTSKIARTEQRLNNLGFFEKVKINNEPGTKPDRTVINVDVQEKSTGEISLGGGFSSTDGPLADFGIRETNLMGRGQDLRFKATLSSIRQQYDIGFTEPYFLDRDLSAGFDIFRTQLDLRDESSYRSTNNGGALRLGYALTEKLQHSLNYTLRRTEITDIQPSASIYIRSQAGITTTSSVGHALIYEDRNNKFLPTNGSFLRFSQDVAGLGGDTHYLKNELRSGYYYPVAPKWTLSLLGAGGYIAGIGEKVRLNDRFYLGGKDFRGFETYGVGPHDKITGDALGGNIYYTVTPELTFPLGLPDDLGFLGAVFVDAGSLWEVEETGPNVVDAQSVRVSAGVGFAWTSPFGPLRIDFAQALLKEKTDKTQVFQFNFGTRF